MSKKLVNMSIDEGMLAKLDQAASEALRTRSNMIEVIISLYFDSAFVDGDYNVWKRKQKMLKEGLTPEDDTT